MRTIRCDVEALLIIELDGPAVEVDHLIEQVSEIAKKNKCSTSRISTSEAERLLFWAGRKAAFPAVGRISPDYFCMDGTIPRKRLSEVLNGMAELSKKHGLRVANVFHAGDGNLHPLILYDANVGDELDAGRRIRRGYFAALRQSWRRAHRRAWGRHRKARPHAGHVFGGRPGAAAAPQMRLRRPRPAQSREGVSDAPCLRRAGPHACEGGQAALPEIPRF